MPSRTLAALCILLTLVLAAQAGVVFDGVDDLGTMDNEATFDFTNATGTVVYLGKTTTTSTRYFVSKNGAGTGWQTTLFATGTVAHAIIRNSGGGSAAVRLGTVDIHTGAWFHLGFVLATDTVTSGNNHVSLYADGVLSQAAETNTSVYAPNNDQVILAKNTVGTTFLAGSIDELIIFSGDIGAEKMSILANGHMRCCNIMGTSILAYFPLTQVADGATTNTVGYTDRVGSNTLTMTGGVSDTSSARLMRMRGVE